MRRNKGPETNYKKPSRHAQARASGLLAMRHQVMVSTALTEFQETLGVSLSERYNGKAFTASSLGATVVGSCEYPDVMLTRRQPRGAHLTSFDILEKLTVQYGLGGPIDLELTGDLDIGSKNPNARRQRLILVCSSHVLQSERAAVESILGEAGLPRLKRFGFPYRPHLSIGTIDTHLLPGLEQSDLQAVLPVQPPVLISCGELRPISPQNPE